ncbi:hypothetical protein ANCDUO_23755 [Ancylostoma duodenale]|uniref:Uncharacterized protein n=1 Tax=Ancylostoma duodenale TaxID=51022 RepID=A0A0C2BQY0_9BILA|nr:hypothetical protein ANCDUO_23755 [Ancylostoma duodenale]
MSGFKRFQAYFASSSVLEPSLPALLAQYLWSGMDGERCFSVLSLLWYWCLHFVLSRAGYRQTLTPSSTESADLDKKDLLKDRSEQNGHISISGITIASSAVPWRALFQHPAFW